MAWDLSTTRRPRGSAAGLFAFGQIAEETLPRSCEVERLASGLGSIKFRHLRGLRANSK